VKKNLITLGIIPLFSILSGLILSFPFKKYPLESTNIYYQLPYYITMIFNLILIVILSRQNKIIVKKPLGYLILLLLISKIMFLATRVIFGPLQIDGDITNFYNQGKSYAQNIIPLFEYPPLTLYFFSLVYLIARGVFTKFVFSFALINFLFEIGLVTVVYKLGLKLKSEKLGFYALLFYIISGYFTHFFYSKFNILIMFIISFSVYMLLTKKYLLAGILTVIGFSFKWLPVFLLAYICLYLIKQKLYKNFVFLIVFFVLFQLLISYPIFTSEPDKLIYAYTFQGKREALAESIYLLPELILKFSSNINNLNAPWDSLKHSFFGAKKTTLIQLFFLGFFALYFMLRKKSNKYMIGFSLLSLIIFIIFNRIFSAQFYIYLFFSYIILFMLFYKNRLSLFLQSQFLLAGLNFFIWPTFLPVWKTAVVGFFIINLSLIAFAAKPLLIKKNNNH
jgi:hypothetical protein